MRADRLCAHIAVLAALLWAGTSASQEVQGAVSLRTVHDELATEPPISETSPASVIGVQLERGDGRAREIDAILLRPEDPKLGLSPAACVIARSQDARFTFIGGLDPADAPKSGPVRVRGTLKSDTASYLGNLPLRQLALLAKTGPCNNPQATRLQIIAVDPRPALKTSGKEILRVLLNAPEGRIGLGLGSSEAGARDAPDIPCLRSTARETAAFGVECMIELPPQDSVVVEVRRHRFGNQPLIDRFELLVSHR